MNDFAKQYGDSTLASLNGMLDGDAVLRANRNLKSVLAPPSMSDFDLSILSASTYPSGPANLVQQGSKAQRRGSEPLFGGIYVNQPELQSLDSSEDELPHQDRAARKKAKRAGKSEEEDVPKKQRGRPRLETDDASAADRRRTQIRLAQRAYRHRKETTISNLRQRVETLEATIALMNTTFLTLNDDLLRSEPLASNTQLRHKLHAASARFASITEKVWRTDPSDNRPQETTNSELRQGQENIGEDIGLAKDPERAPGAESAPEVALAMQSLGHPTSIPSDEESMEDLSLLEPESPTFLSISPNRTQNYLESLPSGDGQQPFPLFWDRATPMDIEVRAQSEDLQRLLESSRIYSYSFQGTNLRPSSAPHDSRRIVSVPR